ncbi:trypco2 family protein [Kocuria kalidii]|uniref:trypco2 family protein n=1 Tax=Kocuria kalidii TaxID=3376283 RepID=UPI0037A0AA81
MADSGEPEGALGLADFLSDLRVELDEAQRRAKGKSLHLGLEEVTLSLDIGVTVTTTGEASAKASAKFWVFASAEGSVKGVRASERLTTQHLTLTLKPYMEEIIRDENGQVTVVKRTLNVSGEAVANEDLSALNEASTAKGEDQSTKSPHVPPGDEGLSALDGASSAQGEDQSTESPNVPPGDEDLPDLR